VSILLFMIPIALVLGLIGLAGFIWALKSGQYEDLEGAAYRVLIAEENPEAKPD
jgi:cbb3-type cytochrome oxidase maturation protein